MKPLIRAIDRHMRRRLGVFEFADDPECVFRVSYARTSRTLAVGGREIPPGAPVLELHFWNEQLPPLPPEGPDLSWAVRGQRQWATSCRLLAAFLRNDPRASEVVALGGVTVLFSPGDGSGAERLFRRMGFALSPARCSLGRFGQLWENLYAWLLMWSFNQATLRHRSLLRLRRTSFWTTVDDFVTRYG